MTSVAISNMIDFLPGRVVYEEFAINDGLALTEQLDELDEDLLQVEFPGDITLDLGWYPAFSSNGQFKIYVIRDANWDEPVFYAEVGTLDALCTVLVAARQTALDAALVVA